MNKLTFKTIFKSLLKYKKELIVANIIAVVAVLISLPIPMMIPLLIDEILLKKPSYILPFLEGFLGEGREPYIYVLVVLFLAIALRALFLSLSALQNYFFSTISKNITFDIQKSLIEYISKVSLSEYENFGSGKISSLLVVDVATIDNFLGVSVAKFVVSLMTIIGIGSVLLWIDFKLGMFILILMPFIAFITKFMAKKVGVIKRQENKKIELFQDELGESMELFWQVKASNEEQSFRQRLIEKSDDIKEKSIEFKYKSEFFALISYFLFLAGFEMFRSAGIISVEYGELTIGKMLGIFGYLWVIMAPFQEILSIQYAYHTAKAALDRINGIFDMKLEPEYKEIKNPFKDTLTNSLEIKSLNFSYQKENQTLKDINIKAKKGKKIAIVGETGGGKSTLASLIVGFYQPDSGEILYDGVNYDEIGLDLIRQNVFLVLQSPLLFNNTIRYNLTFGKDVSESELKEAIKVAQLESFIASLENGMDEIVGKNGVKLSGGQRQRLSIARMLIAKPNIVILDESTSSLDVQTEDNLFLELSSFLKQRTTIIIAHRLSTITKADYIYVLGDGKIVEEGRYQELIKMNGLFAKYTNKIRP